MKRAVLSGALGLSVCAATANADPAYYLDWQDANVGAGTASGVITVPGDDPIAVNFAATFADGSPGNLFFAQTAGGTNYWNPSTPYISPEVENAPPDSDIVALVGGVNQIYTVTLSEPIRDPIMAIVSLGSGGNPITYEFDSPFTIVSQGAGFWGGGDDRLQELPGNVLRGNEGHGTIQFDGIFSTFSWEVPRPENWHGFTFGVRTTLELEPEPVPGPDDPATIIPLPAAAWMGLAGFAALGLMHWFARRRTETV